MPEPVNGAILAPKLTESGECRMKENFPAPAGRKPAKVRQLISRINCLYQRRFSAH
ncbi:MAG: hypothetical protein WA417_11865 [Stellaceae bacterium]